MSSGNQNPNLALEKLLARMEELENRIAVLESCQGSPNWQNDLTGSSAAEDRHVAEDSVPLMPFPDGSSIEATIGGSGLAWLGNIVLLLGITFLMQFLLRSGAAVMPFLIGYAAVAGIFVLSRYIRKHHNDMAFLFKLNGHVLLYYVTLRLHFYAQSPLLDNRSIALALLMVVGAVQLFLAIRNRSEILAGLGLTLLTITGVMGDSTHFMLPVMTVIAAISVYFLHRYGWWRLLIISVALVYLGQLLWLMNNPVVSHQAVLIREHNFGFIYLFICAAIYSLAALFRPQDRYPGSPVIAAIILNGLGFSLMVSLYTLAFFKDHYVAMYGSIAMFCLAYSIVLKFRSEWKIIAAFYALYSFVAVSVTVYGLYAFPRSYLLLSLQSLLVVSMALWFRSRAIVVMNTFLFIILLIAYLASKEHLDGINFSFALVSLATARILNWKKGMLEIRTELMRNTYLSMGFLMTLYALYQVVPGEFVTLSWTLAGVFFFAMSILIRNVKYRYLALGSVIAAAIYLFIVDLASVELVFRVVALMFLALISLGVSLYYRKRLKKAPSTLP